MSSFTIKDLENLSGIKAHTLRIWEQRYKFLKPSRTFTNIRYYSNEELKKVLNIALLNKYGYKISHIDKMNEQDISEKILALSQSEAVQESIVNELIRSMIDLDMQRFETTLDHFITAKGIEKSITKVIFPFLEKIGILWQTNHINPAQEHLVSNIVRQKLIVGIEKVKPSLDAEKSVLLFLPEGEYHELGLLFVYYILKSRGVSCTYLGACIPMKDVAYVVGLQKPDYLYCHITSNNQSFNFERFLNQSVKNFPETPLIISGFLTLSYEKKIHPPIYFKRSLEQVMEFATTL